MTKVTIEMLATLSGDGESWGPGSVLSVDADEAERLIGLGAAFRVEKAGEAVTIEIDANGILTPDEAKAIIAPKRGRKAKA